LVSSVALAICQQLADIQEANGLKGLGGDIWSEFAFMVNYLHGSLNDTDVNGGGDASFWDSVGASSLSVCLISDG
jgi:hypothetical protein